jgi:hypothetical protein
MKKNKVEFLTAILLGGLSGLSSSILVIYFYFSFLKLVFDYLKIVNKGNSSLNTLLPDFGHLLGLEFIIRLLKVHDFIPYEVGKYLLILFSLLLLLKPQKSTNFRISYFIYCIVLFPAFFYDKTGNVRFVDTVFSGFGPLGASLFLFAVSRLRISYFIIQNIMRKLYYAIISGLIYLLINTPKLSEVNFEINANFGTTAGAATNQVATYLGVGLILAAFSLKENLNFSLSKLFDIIFFGLFLFQGVITFSRGGMIVSIIAVGIIFFYNSSAITKIKKFKHTKILYLFILLGIVSILSIGLNRYTKGKLFARYSGETEGTFRGTQEKTLSKITSGRNDLLEDDLIVWLNNPLFGVGIGASMYERAKFGTGMAPHLEMSRLLSEHGLLGLIHFLITMHLGVTSYRNRHKTGILPFVFFIISFLTGFHSAMRTFVTPFFMGLTATGFNLQYARKQTK